MSIENEIIRLKNAKNSIKTAIENKGVIVGNAKIDVYASKINEIQSSEFDINDYINTVPTQNASGSASIVSLNIKKLPELDLSGLTNARYLFFYCRLLEEIEGVVDISFSDNNTGMFGSNGASAPINLVTCYIKNVHSDLDIHYCVNLSKESLLYLFNNAQTVSSGTLNLGSTLKGKLTAEEIAIAENKGWTVV